jgi:hypothetical protein
MKRGLGAPRSTYLSLLEQVYASITDCWNRALARLGLAKLKP